MNDKVYWDTRRVTLTDSQLRTGSSTYPLSSITSVHVERMPQDTWNALGRLATMGLVLFSCGLLSLADRQSWGLLTTALGGLLVLLCALGVVSLIRSRVVKVGLVSGRDARIIVSDKSTGVELAEALNQALLDRDRPLRAPVGVADELSRLAALRDSGVITLQDWEQAKALFLGKPASRRDEAIALLQRLHELRRAGVLSESEYNMKKWDVLASS